MRRDRLLPLSVSSAVSARGQQARSDGQVCARRGGNLSALKAQEGLAHRVREAVRLRVEFLVTFTLQPALLGWRTVSSARDSVLGALPRRAREALAKVRACALIGAPYRRPVAQRCQKDDAQRDRVLRLRRKVRVLERGT